MMDLNEHGAACRCLLRLRENEGEPGISDQDFIARYLPRYPDWEDRPGATDASTTFELAKDLHLADRIEIFRDYDRVLKEHRAGQSVLVCTERAPQPTETEQENNRYVTLMVAMNETSFTVWCPHDNGQSDVLPTAARAWWDKWLAIGMVLHRPRP